MLTKTSHPYIKDIGSKESLLFMLDDHGTPSEIIWLSKEDTKQLWRYQEENKKGFPGFKVNKPLLSLEQSKKINELDWEKASIKEKVAMLQGLNFDDCNLKSNEFSLSAQKSEDLLALLYCKQTGLENMKTLLQLFPHTAKEVLPFCRNMILQIKKELTTTTEEVMINSMKELLIGHLNKQEKRVSEAFVYFDYNYANDGEMVKSKSTKLKVISYLNQIDDAEISDNKEILSPLSGELRNGVGHKYPSPNLPEIGITYLYSKNKDIPCLCKYGQMGTSSFQIARTEANAMNDALEFLTAPEQLGKTWKPISNYEKKNILLAYAMDDPGTNAKLAELLGDPSDYESDEYQKFYKDYFSALSRSVINRFDIACKSNPAFPICFIILEKLDKGRTQIMLESTIPYSVFRKNLIAWETEVNNQPLIMWQLKNKREGLNYKVVYPGPNEIYYLMRYQTRDEKKLKTQGVINLRMIYQLYMPENVHAYEDVIFLQTILQAIMEEAFSFLKKFVNTMTQNQDFLNNSLKKQMLISEKYISVIAIILFRMKVRKEDYMKDVAFNVGQFLQLSDMLHKEYCIQVRNKGNEKNALPPQLIGNELLNIASEHPVEGFNRLRERMRIYLAWAKTNSNSSQTITLILEKFGMVSSLLSDCDLPIRFDVTQQAQVLLGYLAYIPLGKKEDSFNA